MGHIFLKTSILAFTGHAIYRVVENEAPTVEVTRQTFAAPHPERGVTFDGLRPIMHEVQLWESIDGTALTTFKGSIDIDASTNSELQVLFFDIVVDRGNPGLTVGDTGDPVNSTVQYLDIRMKDQLYSINQRGYGPLRPDEYQDESATQGGFSLLSWQFETADTYFITVYAATVAQTPAVAGELDVVLEDADTVLDNTHYGKLVIGTGGGDTRTLTFPEFSTIPDKTRMSFSAQYGTYKYLKLACDTGDSIKFNDGDQTALFLSRDERIDLIWKDGVCYVVNYEGQAKKRGELFGGYGVRPGYILGDGTEYTAAQLSGLWDWLVNDAPAAIKTTYALWNASTGIAGETVYTHKGLYAVDLVGEKFKVPFVEGMFERYLLTGDGARTPNTAGGYQHHEVYSHTHSYSPGDAIGVSDNANDRAVMVPGVQTRITTAYGGTETRGRNTAKIPLITL